MNIKEEKRRKERREGKKKKERRKQKGMLGKYYLHVYTYINGKFYQTMHALPTCKVSTW